MQDSVHITRVPLPTPPRVFSVIPPYTLLTVVEGIAKPTL